MSTTITGIDIVFSNGVRLQGVSPIPQSPGLPHRLEAHSSIAFLIDMQPVGAGVAATLATGGTPFVRASVDLGSGKSKSVNLSWQATAVQTSGSSVEAHSDY